MTAVPLLILVPPALAAAPSNDDFDQATSIGALPFTQDEDTSEATPADDDPGCSGASNATVWFSFAPGQDTSLTADTFGTDYDTTLGVYTGTRGSLTEVACNDDAGSGLQSKATFDATGGTTYFFMIASYENGGQLTFSLDVHRTATKLRVSTSKKWVFAGQSVSVTAHLDAFQDTQNQTISIFGTPSGGSKKLVATGQLDGSGSFSTTARPTATTTYTAEWTGDDTYLPATSNRVQVPVGLVNGSWFGNTAQGWSVQFTVTNGSGTPKVEVEYLIHWKNCSGTGFADVTLKYTPPLPFRNGSFDVRWNIKNVLVGRMTGRFTSRSAVKGTMKASISDHRTGCHGDLGAGIGWHASHF